MTARTDLVFLTGLECYGYHGVHAPERELGQRFVIDLEVETDLRAPAVSDALSDTVSYSDLARLAKGVVEGESRQLIEGVAVAVALAVLRAAPLAAAVTVTLRKPHAPIKGLVFETAGVRVRRSREDLA